MKIAVAMSGGVDSSAAAAILKESGATLVPPFDHPMIMAGQGTAARSGLAKKSVMPFPQLFDIGFAYPEMLFSCDGLDQQVTAHADATVNRPSRARDTIV